MAQPDYSQAEWRGSPNFWAGFDNRDFIVVHATASGDNATEYVPDFNAATGKSTHYAIAMDGHVVQYVEEKNSAWGNCCASGNSPFMSVPGYNWNKSTVSIENEKHSTDNSKPLTNVQYQSLLKLVRDIAKRWNIPLVHGVGGKQRGVVYHHDIDPVNRAGCPGNFPYDTFFQDLQGGGEIPVKLNASGEVADYVDVSQFEPAESEAECGFFAVAEQVYAGKPGTGPRGTPEQVDQWADSHGGINTEGVSIDDMHNLFHQAGLHYWDIDSINDTSDQNHDNAEIRAALAHGYPVIVTIPESGVYDLILKGNPYAPNWSPQSNHIFTITGVMQDGNYLVHDQAAVQGGIFGQLAPQPRRYRADSLHIHWASIVQLPWLPSIQNGDPLSWKQPVAPQPIERSTWLSTGQETQANDIWTIGVQFVKAVFQADVLPSSGIKTAWQHEYMNGRNRGFPTTPEQKTVNWNNNPIIVQYFSSGARCEWDGSAHWYN